MLPTSLDMSKLFRRIRGNGDITRVLLMPVSTTHMQRERILRAAGVTLVAAWHPVMDKMQSLLLEWIGGCIKCGVPLSYT